MTYLHDLRTSEFAPDRDAAIASYRDKHTTGVGADSYGGTHIQVDHGPWEQIQAGSWATFELLGPAALVVLPSLFMLIYTVLA